MLVLIINWCSRANHIFKIWTIGMVRERGVFEAFLKGKFSNHIFKGGGTPFPNHSNSPYFEDLICSTTPIDNKNKHTCLAIFGQIDLSPAVFLLGKIIILTLKGVVGVLWLKMLEWFGSGVSWVS